MTLFKDEIIDEYIDWQKANPDNFTWWNYVNLKSDITVALGFAKFFFAELIEKDDCIFIKDNFSSDRYNGWKSVCKDDKNAIERAMNTYEVQDFFHINTDYDDENIDEQVEALAEALKFFWSLSAKQQFPDRDIVVEVYEEYDALCITLFQEKYNQF